LLLTSRVTHCQPPYPPVSDPLRRRLIHDSLVIYFCCSHFRVLAFCSLQCVVCFCFSLSLTLAAFVVLVHRLSYGSRAAARAKKILSTDWSLPATCTSEVLLDVIYVSHDWYCLDSGLRSRSSRTSTELMCGARPIPYLPCFDTGVLELFASFEGSVGWTYSISQKCYWPDDSN